jgi:hypothetical protein
MAGMKIHSVKRSLARLAVAIPVLAVAMQCAPREPRTDAERAARGRELIERMGKKLNATPAFILSTDERSEWIRQSGVVPVALTRETVVRKPDRLHFKTAGDLQVEGWYDGIGLTVVMHKEKVFAQARMPETLDRVLDTLHERYGIATPIGDFVYSNPAHALLSDTTTGGWVGRETINGQSTDHLAFKDKGVNWEVWLATGDQLPRKSRAEFPEEKRLRKVEITFTNWNLAPTIPGDVFTPKVPPDYEGIAMVQRARVLRNLPPDPAPASNPIKK